MRSILFTLLVSLLTNNIFGLSQFTNKDLGPHVIRFNLTEDHLVNQDGGIVNTSC